jgi:hypothetical protein
MGSGNRTVDHGPKTVTVPIEPLHEASRIHCPECEVLEAARVTATMHYRDLMDARRDLLQEGHPVSPSLAAVLVRAEIAVNEVHKKLAEHRATVCLNHSDLAR